MSPNYYIAFAGWVTLGWLEDLVLRWRYRARRYERRYQLQVHALRTMLAERMVRFVGSKPPYHIHTDECVFPEPDQEMLDEFTHREYMDKWHPKPPGVSGRLAW